MIQFWFSKYELQPLMGIGAVAGSKPRVGALFKIQWPNKLIGYADLHPWPELGDHELDVHIDALRAGKLSQLMEQTIWLARRDAEAREARTHLLTGLPKVKNHFLLNDYSKLSDAMLKEMKSSGYTILKVKVGKMIDEESQFILKTIRQNTWLSIRLDFNAKVDFSRFERFMTPFTKQDLTKLEFVEDPIPWNPEQWTEAAKLAPLAIDNEIDKLDLETFKEPSFKVVVLKPARQDVEKVMKFVSRLNLKAVVTSSLDHPVGVIHAAAVAGHYKKLLPNTMLDSGCLSLRTYKPNEFTSRIQAVGPFIQSVPGFGVGFDELLGKIEWTPLKK